MGARASLHAVAARLIAVCLTLGAAATHAGSLGVSPIRIELSEAVPTAALSVENGGSTAMVLQLQVMRWSAEGKEDVYLPSDELVAMPPIMTLGPGERQIVRMGLSQGPDPDHELAYRLYIEEVPPPPKPGYQGLQVALRVGVPVFVAPQAAAAPQLEWRARRHGGDAIALSVVNAGNAHQRLLKLVLRAPGDGRALATQQAVGDLLPGQAREWRVGVGEGAPDGRLRLTVETDRGPVDVDLELDAP